MKPQFIMFLATCLLGFMTGCDNQNNNTIKKNHINPLESVPLISYSLINTFPHDTTLFTEGLLIHKNQLFESTGSPDEFGQTISAFGIIDLKTGKMNIKGKLERKYFGEGIAILKNKIYQLTYKHKIGFIYNTGTFKRTGEFRFSNKEGWGLTTDGTDLIMSDGTSTLTYLDPVKLEVVKTLKVSAEEYRIKHINELEYIKGYIYANIWLTNYIVKIDPGNGKVLGKIDLSALHDKAKKIYFPSDVPNGIAYDSISNKIYVTGKLWPFIYQIKI